ncbi:hypothetical protein JCM5350_002024 [Sporobolomyces pararoseus]
MAVVLSDQNTPYHQLSQEEQDLPHCIFLERGRFNELEQEVERLEADPIPFDTLHNHFIRKFPLYRALYRRKQGLKDPFCIEAFQPILAAARARPDPTLPFYIIVLIFACLKPEPDDQLPLDPAAPGPTAKKARRQAAILRKLFKMLVATIVRRIPLYLEVLCPCGGPAREARSERRGIGPQSQPTAPVYEVSRLFTRATVACLKYDNVEIDHGYAEGSWASTMLKLKKASEPIDLASFPKRSPILNCDVYANYHPRAVLRELLPFPRSIHLCLGALAHVDQLSKHPQLPQISLRKIYGCIVNSLQDDEYPIGSLDWLLAAIGKNENDPTSDLVEALLEARTDYAEHGGLYRTVLGGGGGGCGTESDSSLTENLTLKYECDVLYRSGLDPSKMKMKEVGSIFYDRQSRLELVKLYKVDQSEVDKLSTYEVNAQLWFRHNKQSLIKRNVDVTKLKDEEIYPLSIELAARAQLEEAGFNNVESMDREQVNTAVHPIRIAKYLKKLGIDTTGMSNYQLKSTYFQESKFIPQVEKLKAILDQEDFIPPLIPEPVNHVTGTTANAPIDATAPLSTFVTPTTANQFFETINQGGVRARNNDRNDFADLLAAFPASQVFRLIQFFPYNSDGGRARKSNYKTYGTMIDRALYQKWYDKKEELGELLTKQQKPLTERGANKFVMNNHNGWKGALEDCRIKIVLTDEAPEHLRPQLLTGLNNSPWIRGGMRCGDKAYENEQSSELKWFALLFSSTMWDLVKED